MSGQAALKIAAFASPVIWFTAYSAQFALAPLACVWHSNLVLWVVALAALVLDVASGLAAWSAWQRRAQPEGPETAPAPMPPWLALSGVILSASFFVVIVAQMIPNLILAGCA